MGYVAAYLIPFVGFPLNDASHIVALVFFFILLACLYVRTDLIHINPTLEVMGFRVIEITCQPGVTKRMLTTKRRSLPSPGESVLLVSLNDDLYVERIQK